MTIQPEASPLERFKSTQATTPSPSRMRINVPTNSPKKGVVAIFLSVKCVRTLLSGNLGPCLESPFVFPAKGPSHRFFPFGIQTLTCAAFHVRFPRMVHAPLFPQFPQILIEADRKSCGVGSPQRSRFLD